MVDWASFDDMVAKAVEENLDGERVRIVPRIAGEFTGYVADDKVGIIAGQREEG
ncbi:hypothetical protein [Methylocystis echinoides]|uniref:Uncharacterized protein n=1 Tax=Methylocystis echinoides TaxID=29468 RepID=A0A9W6GWH4_9HYPH|nr:hypothetical protein [Methylocystis echinoides]GLI94307.1 hypothetical protein LMG27198_32990 [Methylocystis echinoides]